MTFDIKLGIIFEINSPREFNLRISGQKLSANVLFQCNDTTINTSMTSGIAIETGLVLLLSLLPIVEKSIGRMTNLGEDNAVLIFQSIIVAYIVKTFIGVTGAMMNPLLAVVVNFGCLNSQGLFHIFT